MRTGLTAAAAVLAAPLAQAAVITFETAPYGSFNGPVTESGFTYSRLSGTLIVNNIGNPGQDMEGNVKFGAGMLGIVAVGSPADFTFSGPDYAAIRRRSQTLTVTGLLGGSTVGTDTYTLANTDVSFPTYANWTTELASNLAGKTIDALQIALNGGIGRPSSYFYQAIDNVVLAAPSSVPGPPPGRCSALG